MGENGLLIIFVLLVVILVALGLYVFFVIRRFSKDVLGEDLKTAYQLAKDAPDIPKSLSGMDRIYEPQIQKDFPDVNINEFKSRAKNALLEIFNSIELKDSKKLHAVSELIETKVKNILVDQERLGLHEFFDKINIHNVVISNYKREQGYKSIVFQIALEYIHYIKKGEEIVNGSETDMQQDRFEISLAYIQDVDKLDEVTRKTGIMGLNCPNCAAPIKTIGQKYCEYCKTGLIDINIKSWIVIDYARK